MCCLFDTGGSHTIINRRALSPQMTPTTAATPVSANTAAGNFSMTQTVQLRQVLLPEFSKSLHITEINAYIFDSPNTPYDIILGRDLLQQMKIDVCYSTRTVNWIETSIPLKAPTYWHNGLHLYLHFASDDALDQGDCYVKEILPSKYEKVDINNVIKEQTHLDDAHKSDLKNVLQDYTDILFNGKLGCYPHSLVHLELKDDAQPFHAKPYAVPHAHLQIFKNELDRLVQIGVMAPTGGSEWAAGTFIVPKKDGRVRWVTDFRQLNKHLRRKQYPIPRIQDILHRRNGYKYFTKIDISMQYYTFPLDEYSQDLCTIVTPFGKYKYLRLPMGIKQSPDIAQELMEKMLRPFQDDTEIYIDDIGIFSKTWDHHLSILRKVLTALQENNLTVNPLKCEWAIKETDWLGYWLTPNGLKPWSKKVRAILALQPPTNMKQLRSFIGTVTYYRDMWPHRSHILAPLTEMTGSSEFYWTPRQQEAFQNIKALIARDTLLRYPDHNLPFQIFTDASDFQLGSVIMQNNKPVAFYSRKLSKAQMNYNTMEKELLSIVSTLQEFRSMLLGADIHIYTDHKNLTHKHLTSQRVIRWRLFLEDFSPTFHYIKGSENIIADALSRLPFNEEIIEGTAHLGPKISPPSDGFCLEQDDKALFDCFLHHPNIDIIPYPLSYDRLQQQQQQDLPLKQTYQHDYHYIVKSFTPTIELITYQHTPTSPSKIVIPTTMLLEMVIWYHLNLNHPGATRLYNTIAMHFYHRQLMSTVNDVNKRCDFCQRYKNTLRGYGQLPPKEATFNPWETVAVDLIGPWTFSVNNITSTFSALTIIDTDTNLTEAVSITNKRAQYIAMKFENTWLARYPKPNRCIHDNGGEFTGEEFQKMLRLHHIKDVPTTIKNPQSNAICERMHQTIENMLRTFLYNQSPHDFQQLQDLVDSAIASAIYAMRTTIHTTLKTTPGILAFHRDMLLNIPITAQIQDIQNRRQKIIDQNNAKENRKRHPHQYQPHNLVLLSETQPTKLQQRFKGPYTITQVHDNGTVTIQLHNNITQRINIRRIKPYYR